MLIGLRPLARPGLKELNILSREISPKHETSNVFFGGSLRRLNRKFFPEKEETMRNEIRYLNNL